MKAAATKLGEDKALERQEPAISAASAEPTAPIEEKAMLANLLSLKKARTWGQYLEANNIPALTLFTEMVFATDLEAILEHPALTFLLDILNSKKQQLCEDFITHHLAHTKLDRVSQYVDHITTNKSTRRLLKARPATLFFITDYNGLRIFLGVKKLLAQVNNCMQHDQEQSEHDDDIPEDIVNFTRYVSLRHESAPQILWLNYLLICLSNYLTNSTSDDITAVSEADSASGSACASLLAFTPMTLSFRCQSKQITRILIALNHANLQKIYDTFISLCEKIHPDDLITLLCKTCKTTSSTFAEKLYIYSSPYKKKFHAYLHLLTSKLTAEQFNTILASTILPYTYRGSYKSYKPGHVYGEILISLMQLPNTAQIHILANPEFMIPMCRLKKTITKDTITCFIHLLGKFTAVQFLFIQRLLLSPEIYESEPSTPLLFRLFNAVSNQAHIEFLNVLYDKMGPPALAEYFNCSIEWISGKYFNPLLFVAKHCFNVGKSREFLRFFYNLYTDGLECNMLFVMQKYGLIWLLAENNAEQFYNFINSKWLSQSTDKLPPESQTTMYQALARHKKTLLRHILSSSNQLTRGGSITLLQSITANRGQSLLNRVMWQQCSVNPCSLEKGSLWKLNERLQQLTNADNTPAASITDCDL